MKFNRQIGDHAGKFYSIEGRSLIEGEFQAHLAQVLPGPEDKKILEPIFRAGNWMTAGAANA
jgi:hypothetical protein